VIGQHDAESRKKLGLFVLAIFLWAWFSVPLPQVVTLYWIHHHSGVVSSYLGTEQALITYYKQLIWGALLLSFVGSSLLWLIPRKLAAPPIVPLVVGCLLGILGARLMVEIVSPTDLRARNYPIHPKYFVLATLFAGLVAGYLRFSASDQASHQNWFSEKLRFVIEGVIVWFAVLQIFVGMWLPVAAGNADTVASVQLDVALPAFFWATFCGLLLWKRRPGTRLHALLWAIGIGIVVSKVAGLLVVFLGMMGHSSAAFSSWVVARLEWPRSGLGLGLDDYALGAFLMFGPSLFWGLVMGLRRWQYLQKHKEIPLPVAPN
jgi:hypothetical protein